MFKHLIAFFSTKQVYGTLIIIIVTLVILRIFNIIISKLDIPCKKEEKLYHL